MQILLLNTTTGSLLQLKIHNGNFYLISRGTSYKNPHVRNLFTLNISKKWIKRVQVFLTCGAIHFKFLSPTTTGCCTASSRTGNV